MAAVMIRWPPTGRFPWPPSYSTPSKTTTARRIEARFASRRVGKVWRYSDAVLAQTLTDAVAYWGRPPRVAEFDHWRERELEIRRARGEEAPHLPSPHPYRKRWGSWEGALTAHDYEPELMAKRLDESLLAGRLRRDDEES
ncbi:MAG: hypothetical protein LC790_16605 [Actinobacteria bacterium]|nr:hypothetical protein [Actinomycetota bacterium]